MEGTRAKRSCEIDVYNDDHQPHSRYRAQFSYIKIIRNLKTGEGMKVMPHQIAALVGSALLMLSGMLRFFHSGSPKELAVGVLYFIANIIIFCL